MKTREEAIRRANELFPGKSSRNYNRYNGFLACFDWLNEPEPETNEITDFIAAQHTAPEFAQGVANELLFNKPEQSEQNELVKCAFGNGKLQGEMDMNNFWREKIQNLQGWVSIAEKNEYPKEDQTVWMYNAKDKSIWLGCYVYLKNAGWFWAISNGSIFTQEGKIMVEADIDDFYEITHWCAVPGLPLG